MATLVLGAVGSAIGGAFGGAILGFSGAAIGGFIGSTIGALISVIFSSSIRLPPAPPRPPQRAGLIQTFREHGSTLRQNRRFVNFTISQFVFRWGMVLVAPLYAAGEAPIEGVSSEALAAAVQARIPSSTVEASPDLTVLAQRVAACTEVGDLVLAMGAGDVNSLWDRLAAQGDPGAAPALVA